MPWDDWLEDWLRVSSILLNGEVLDSPSTERFAVSVWRDDDESSTRHYRFPDVWRLIAFLEIMSQKVKSGVINHTPVTIEEPFASSIQAHLDIFERASFTELEALAAHHSGDTS